MSTEPQSKRLPFEPKKKQQKPAKKIQAPVETGKNTKEKPETTAKTAQKTVNKYSKEEMAIPKVVSDRMARRMAVFCGVPTAFGMLTFVVSYFIVTQSLFKLPHVAVVLVSMGFFGLGVLGLTYGVLSASWDEALPGTLLGWGEFTTNSGRMVSAWRSSRQKQG